MFDYPSKKAKTVKIVRKLPCETEPDIKPLTSVWLKAERITRNLACAVLLIITIYAVKEARIPDGDLLYTAANGVIDIPWEETLGRIQFVNAVSFVSGDAGKTYYGMPELQILSSLPVAHAWAADEPYLSFKTNFVYCLAPGTVDSVMQQSDGSISVTVLHDNGFSSVYHNLYSCDVREGTVLTQNQQIGTAHSGEMIYVMKYDGFPVDPTSNIHLS